MNTRIEQEERRMVDFQVPLPGLARDFNNRTNESNQAVIILLIEELVSRYPCLTFAYIILDREYDAEEIHHDIYEFFGIIPIIIRKKMVYPK